MGIHDGLFFAFGPGLSVVGFFYGLYLAGTLPLLRGEQILLIVVAAILLLGAMFPIFSVSLLLTMIIVQRRARPLPRPPIHFTGRDVVTVLVGLPVPWIVSPLIEALTYRGGSP